MLKKINSHIYLDDVEINILNHYDIPYQGASSYDEILLLIDRFAENDLTDEELEDLDYVANLISERKYYTNTNK